MSLMLGCRVCQISRFGQPENTLKMFIDQGVTFSAGVPTIWQGIRAALEASPVDRAGFKVCTVCPQLFALNCLP